VDVSWSADGKHLAFIRKGSTEIFTATLSSPQIYQSTTTINEVYAASSCFDGIFVSFILLNCYI